MSSLTDSSGDQGYLKAGLLGFAGCGKSWTAAMLAVALKRRLKIDMPIAMFDTEGGSVYIRPVIKKMTGADLLAKRARSFQDMMKWGESCVKAGITIGICDSVTHPLRS